MNKLIIYVPSKTKGYFQGTSLIKVISPKIATISDMTCFRGLNNEKKLLYDNTSETIFF